MTAPLPNAATEFRLHWRDLAGATIGLGCGVGMYTPITSLFFRALEADFGWSKTALAAGLLALPLTGLALPLAGRLIDRFGVRPVAAISAVAMAVAFLGLSLIGRSLPAFYAGFIGFNILGCATGPVAYTRPLAARFTVARGAAIGIALTGISISGIVLSPLLGAMLAHAGWRAGYQLLAGVALVGGLTAAALIRPTEGPRTLATGEGLERREAMRTRAFWQLGLGVFLAGAASVGFVSQLQSAAVEFGVGAERSGLLVAVLALSVLVFRPSAGWSLDRFAPGRVAATFFVLSGLGLGLWLVPHGSMPLAVAATVALGLSVGSEHAFISYFCARLFGTRAYSAIFGALALFLYFGMAVGGLIFARSRDVTGSYLVAIICAIVGLIAAGVLFAALPTRAAARN